MGAACRIGLCGVGRKKLGAKLGEIHFLGICRLCGVLAEDHGACEVLDAVPWLVDVACSGTGEQGNRVGDAGGKVPLLNNVVENLHHGRRLILGETFLLKALDELESIEVMVALAPRRRVEKGGPRRNKGRLPRRVCWWHSRPMCGKRCRGSRY